MSQRETKSDGVQRAPPRRRRKKNTQEQTTDEPTTLGDSEEPGTARGPKKAGPKTKKTPTVRRPTAGGSAVPGRNVVTPEVENAMGEFVKAVMAKGVEGLRKEFAELKTYTAPDFKCEAFNAAANATRNRYKDVVCLDATRVPLTLNVPPEPDYIHANWVKMEGVERTYIATQGPLEATISDFWRLVHQESAASIVMLCNCVENGKAKCAIYFPEATQYKTFGCMFVNNKKTDGSEEKLVTHTIETLPEGCSNSTVVKLFHMTDWPDRGVPEKPMGVLRLLRALPPGLCVIHCSAGIGRTGSVILVDAVLSRLLKGQVPNVRETFQQLRNQRASAIQTEAQYVLVHTCVIEYIRAKMQGKYREIANQFADDVKKANMV